MELVNEIITLTISIVVNITEVIIVVRYNLNYSHSRSHRITVINSHCHSHNHFHSHSNAYVIIVQSLSLLQPKQNQREQQQQQSRTTIQLQSVIVTYIHDQSQSRSVKVTVSHKYSSYHCHDQSVTLSNYNSQVKSNRHSKSQSWSVSHFSQDENNRYSIWNSRSVIATVSYSYDQLVTVRFTFIMKAMIPIAVLSELWSQLQPHYRPSPNCSKATAAAVIVIFWSLSYRNGHNQNHGHNKDCSYRHIFTQLKAGEKRTSTNVGRLKVQNIVNQWAI